MPLLDHFSPPLSRTHPWRSFHGAWAAAIARLLNQGVLPEGYYAVPLVDRDGPVEIDVAALRDSGATAGTPTWIAPKPSLAVAVELPPADDVEVHILTDDGDPRLMAAIELVSPSNKDRPQSRESFVSKCITYLQHGSSVIIVDTVTTRRADLNSELLDRLNEDAKIAGDGLSATSYRVFKRRRTASKGLKCGDPHACRSGSPSRRATAALDWCGTCRCRSIMDLSYQTTPVPICGSRPAELGRAVDPRSHRSEESRAESTTGIDLQSLEPPAPSSGAGTPRSRFAASVSSRVISSAAGVAAPRHQPHRRRGHVAAQDAPAVRVALQRRRAFDEARPVRRVGGEAESDRARQPDSRAPSACRRRSAGHGR